VAEPSAAQRKLWAKMGIAMPDGSYYIRDAADLDNAIKGVGRGEAAGDSGAAIRKHIMARAAALKLSSKIPSTWNSDGSLKQMDPVEAFLIHFGVKGMHWGVRKDRSSSAPSSDDHAQTRALLEKLKAGGGIHALSNTELGKVNERLNLEQNFNRLTADKSSLDKGHQFVKTSLGLAKTGLDAYNTGNQVAKILKDVKKAAA
jgi:hypothetical protein